MRPKGAAGPIARRYARALLDVATAPPADAEQAGQVRTALEGARALLESHPELMRALSHPVAAAEARQRVVSAVWAQAPALVTRLLQLLVERDRMRLLPAIAEAYAEAWNAARGVVSAEAVSAVELHAGQKEALREALERATGKGIELVTRVEPVVLGGLRVTMGGRTFDGTVTAQLLSLKRRLQGAA